MPYQRRGRKRGQSTLKNLSKRIRILEKEQKIDNPDIICVNQQIQSFAGTSGQQNWWYHNFGLHDLYHINAIRDFYAGTDATSLNTDDKFQIKYTSLNCNIMNNSNFPIIGNVYFITPKSDVSSSPITDLTTFSNTNAPAPQALINEDANINEPFARLADFPEWHQKWRVLKKKRIILPPDAVKRFYFNGKKGMFTYGDYEHEAFLANRTVLVMLQFRGFYGWDNTNSKMAYAPFRLSLHTVRRTKVKQVNEVNDTVVGVTRLIGLTVTGAAVTEPTAGATIHVTEPSGNEDTVNQGPDGTDA